MLPVGYFPCTQDPPHGDNVAGLIDELVEQAELCEAVGFDGFYFTEHHQQEDGYLPSPVLLAGMVGMRTRRIKVGTCVLLAPLYHPVRLAEDIAVVDQATRGRMVAAVASPTSRTISTLSACPSSSGPAAPRNASRFCARRGPASRSVTPADTTRSRTCASPRGPTRTAVRRSGWRAGCRPAWRAPDAWATAGSPTRSVAAGHQGLRRAVPRRGAQHGRKPFVVLMRDCVIGSSWQACVEKSAPTMVTHRWYYHYGAYVKDHYLADVKRPEDLNFELCARDRLIAGSPEQCLEQLLMWKEAIQPDYVMLRMRQPGGPAQAEALADIRLFGEKVIPHL